MTSGRIHPGPYTARCPAPQEPSKSTSYSVPARTTAITKPQLRAAGGGILVATGTAVLLTLSAAVPFEFSGDTAQSRLVLGAGEKRGFALQYQSGGTADPAFWSQADIVRRLADTVQCWISWSRIHQNYRGPWQELVAGSGRVLQALSYYPTGAIVAAPTTSLPEVAGGTRNWDYRYTWIRDASMTLQALWVAACPDEAGKFFQFLATAAAGQLASGGELQIMFGAGGERRVEPAPARCLR